MIYDCSTHCRWWYLNFIAILSFVCPKLACIELLISLHNGRHLFANGFVTVRPIAMKFRWDKESVSSLKFWKFHLNLSKFSRKLTMVFKLDLKTMTFTAFRTPAQNGLMQKVNIFCLENEHLHAFYAPTKKSYKLDKGIMLNFVSEKKSAITFGEGCTCLDHSVDNWLRIYKKCNVSFCFNILVFVPLPSNNDRQNWYVVFLVQTGFMAHL